MRDIVPRTTPSNKNKENSDLKRSASTAGKSDVRSSATETARTKVTVEMKTVLTPQTSYLQSSQFVTPKNPANLARTRSNASALFLKKTPGSTNKGTTPIGAVNITPGLVKKMPGTTENTPFRSISSTTPSQQSKTTVTPLQQGKATPVKRKMPVTPASCSKSNSNTPGIPRKVAASSVSMHQSNTSVLTTSQHDQDEETSHVAVAVRVRPLNQREKKDSCSVVEAGNEGLVTVSADNSSLSFQYDHCFGPLSTQSEVFRSLVHPLLSKALEGYNACLFSYGQTGSGKTYSMMGVENSEEQRCNKMCRESGIIPRFGFSLFERLARGQDASVEVSYFEIYNEKIRDLLSEDINPQKTSSLRVREHPQLGPYVEGLAVHSVASFESLQGWLRLGLSRRATAASAMNDKSSRSHCIFSVTLTQCAGARRSKVHLVDLAGSERLASTSATGDRLKEGVSINTSLLTLGKVISALADKQRKTFVPYRDSLLTWLLSDSLGGNARTVMLATVSPARVYTEETLATLRYACQARTIINRPQLQHTTTATPVAQRHLQEEVDRLRAAREEYERRGAGRELTNLQTELSEVRQKLRNLEKERAEWEERVKASEENRSRQMADMAKRGVAECSAPALRLLTSDPSLSLCFALPGPTCSRKVLGSQQPPADIALEAPLISDEHCALEWRSGVTWLVPGDTAAESYVNGELIQEEVPLAHGDRLALGGELFLLVQLESVTSASIDFEWARMELSLAQNARLNLELAQAKEQAILELQATRAQVEQLGESKNAVEAELELRRGEQDRLVAALKAEVEEARRRREMALTPMDISLAPFASNLLQDLGELEKGIVDAGAGLGLHEMRCLVREATQRCRQLGLYYKFGQVQQAQSEPIPGQPVLQPCVRVRGKDNQCAMCSPHTFLAILDALREAREQGNDDVVQLISQLAWEDEDQPALSTVSNMETSVTVDVAPFRRHLLSLSLTVHEESVSSPNTGAIEKHLLELHSTLAKLQTLTQKQPKVQAQLKTVKNAICQLERACLHPELDSYQHSEPSTISNLCSESGVTNNNLESYEHSGVSRQNSSLLIENLQEESNHNSRYSEISSIRPESSASGRYENGINSQSNNKSDDSPSYTSLDVDMVLNQLRGDQTGEPSLSSSVSTMLHTPPSSSAQPTKSNLRYPTSPHSPTKEVRFTLKKSRNNVDIN